MRRASPHPDLGTPAGVFPRCSSAGMSRTNCALSRGVGGRSGTRLATAFTGKTPPSQEAGISADAVKQMAGVNRGVACVERSVVDASVRQC